MLHLSRCKASEIHEAEGGSITQTEKLSRIQRWRVGRLASGWDGIFMVPLHGELWQVALVEEDGHRRLIVSHAQKNTVPNHVLMCQLRKLFFSDEAMVVQVYTNSKDQCYDIQTLYELSTPVYPFVWDTPPSGANDETDTAEAR